MNFLLYLNEKINPFQSVIVLSIAILILSIFIFSKRKAVKKFFIILVSVSIIIAFYLNIYSYVSMNSFSSFLVSFGNIQVIEICIILFSAINILYFVSIHHMDSDNFGKTLIIFLFSVICAVFLIMSRNFLLMFTGFSVFILTVFQLVSALNRQNNNMSLDVVRFFLRPALALILFFFGFSLLFGATDFKDFNQILQSEYILNPAVILSFIVFGIALYLYFFLFPFQGPYLKMIKNGGFTTGALIWFLYFPAGIFIFLKLTGLYVFYIDKNNVCFSIFLLILTSGCMLAANIGAFKARSARRIISFLFLFFLSVFLLNFLMYSAGIISGVLLNLFNLGNILVMLFSFMPLYSIICSIEKSTGIDSINNIRGVGRENKYTGINLAVIFIAWLGFLSYIKPLADYFSEMDFFRMGVINILLLATIVSGFLFFLVNIIRIIINIFSKSDIKKAKRILFPGFFYIYITFFSLVILTAAAAVLVGMLNVDIAFLDVRITEINF